MATQSIKSNNFSKVPSINFHLWEPCNMRCKFCFATFQDVKKSVLPKGHLPKEESKRVVQEIAKAGFEKITFVGGEPTLCPWLIELIEEAKKFGMNTGIVTNASSINEKTLKTWKPILDWIGISVDSLNEETNINMGRAIAGSRPLNQDFYKQTVQLINHFDFKLKINTVVNSYNKNEDLTDFIKCSKTNRWKIFQVLPIKGQNDQHIDTFKINSEEFEAFIMKHHLVKEIIVSENNDQMQGSYAMIDPAGRFFENSNGFLTYSEPILKVGVQNAYQQAHPYSEKFFDRGGKYDW